MRTLVILALMGLCAPAWAQQPPCTTQDYSDPAKQPDWECPGPDEGILVPDVPFRPSVGLEAGASYRKTPQVGEARLDYDTVLMDKAKALQLGLRIQALRRLRWLERHKMKDLVEVERRYVGDRLTAQLKLEQSRVKEAVQQRDSARKERDSAKKWYRSWTFGLVVGVVTTTAATIAIAYTAK